MTDFIEEELELASQHHQPPVLEDSPSVLMVMLFLFIGGIIGMLLLGIVFGIVQFAAGYDIMTMMQGLSESSTVAERNMARVAQGISHIFMFLVPALVALVFYQNGRRNAGFSHFSWTSDLNWNTAPKFNWLVLGFFLLLVSLPFVHYSYGLNKGLPLPDWMRNSEADINAALKGFLKMDGIGELLLNVFIVAVLPAIGEELLFRGVIQKQFMRKMSPWVSIILAGALFSAIHMQFEGFLPRWIMGIVLGWLFWKSQNIWVPIVAHFLNNGLQVLGSYFYSEETELFNVDEEMEVSVWLGLGSLVLTIALMHYSNFFLKQRDQ